MVDDSFIARMKLHRRHQMIAVCSQRNHKILQQIRAIRGDSERFGHLDDQIRSSQLPAFCELRRRGKIGFVTFWTSGSHPVCQQIEFFICQPSLTNKPMF